MLESDRVADGCQDRGSESWDRTEDVPQNLPGD